MGDATLPMMVHSDFVTGLSKLANVWWSAWALMSSLQIFAFDYVRNFGEVTMPSALSRRL
jgi:hypothetical protein